MDKFAQSLATDEKVVEKNIYFDFHTDGSEGLFKHAYTTSMSKPTVEKIKEHVEKRIKSEVGKGAKVNVVISVSDSDGDLVKNGKGSAKVSANGKNFSVPFDIVDGEISNLTEMDVNGKKVAYNKHTLAEMNKKDEEESSAFIGTDKPANESTDPGFLDSVIRIRDEHMARQTNASNTNRYVVASEDCDKIFKTACSIREVDKTTYKDVEAMIRHKIANAVSSRLEKTASEEVDKKVGHAEEVFNRLAELPLKSVHSMKNGQKILFPERTNNELSMTAGVVFKDIDQDYFRSMYDTSKANISTIVVSYDGRIALLEASEQFLALIDDGANVKLPATSMRAVESRKCYLPIIGNSVIFPVEVVRTGGEIYDPLEAGILKEVGQTIGKDNPVVTVKPMSTKNSSSRGTARCILLPGGKFRYDGRKKRVGGHNTEVSAGRDRLYDFFKDNTNLLNSLGSLYDIDRIIDVDPDTRVIKIKGSITGYVSTKDELKPSYKALSPSELIKTASADKVHVKLVNPEQQLWSARTVGTNRKALGNKLSKKELNTILLSMGYNTKDIGEIITTSKRNGEIYKELPLNTNINRLFDGEVDTLTKKTMRKVKDKVFNKDRAKEAVQNIGISMVSNMLGDVASDSSIIYHGLDAVSKLAETSEATSIVLEKLATEYKSTDLQDVAKLMVAGNRVFNSLTDTYKRDLDLDMFKEACETIVDNKECLEHYASELSSLSKQQFLRRDEYVPYEAINGAMEVISGMYGIAKIASGSCQDLVCTKCGTKVDKPLKNGKCDKCMQEELEEDKEGYKVAPKGITPFENKIQAEEEK